MKTTQTSSFVYPYEEFADHIKAMKTVREWEYTSRFGHVGSAQTSRANNARVVEYFSDCYEDSQEAVQKAELFLTMFDYLGRHAALFSRKELMEELAGGALLAEPALLRAVHHAFTVLSPNACIPPKRILALARAFEQIELCLGTF